jgi:transposase InsO family protein
VPHDTRDTLIDFTNDWSEKTEIPVARFIAWLGTGTSKFYQWRQRYGKANEHNGKIPRDWWLEGWEKEAIIDFHRQHPLEGYRRLTFMMLDQDVVAVSPTSTWRVLNQAGLLRRWNSKPSKKGKGFGQPHGPHRHWHVDVSYINLSGTFYYLLSVLDGYSRFIVHWELRESMTEADVEVILERARELYPEARPRVITDNGPQFIAKDFKEFIRIAGMTHVKTSPYYPQSNGKIERWHRSLKGECIRPGTPLSLEDARRLVTCYVAHYNTVRLHSAIGYVTPKDKLDRREEEIFRERDQKLERAREARRLRRAARKEEALGAVVDPAALLPEPPASPSESASTPAQPELDTAGESAPEAGASGQPGPSGTTSRGPRPIEDLRRLRNEVDIASVISQLGLETKKRGARVSFRCPGCGAFHTATNPRTNLARCFRCARNFNPIDLVMAERGSTFLDAVNYLKDHLASWTS